MSRLSRRDFARAATVAAGAALLPRSAAAQDVAGEAAAAAAPAAHAKLPAAAATKLSAAGQAEADARLATILARWGARLTPQDRAAVATLAAEMQAPLEALRAASLDITDEPALQFHAARKKH